MEKIKISKEEKQQAKQEAKQLRKFWNTLFRICKPKNAIIYLEDNGIVWEEKGLAVQSPQ